MTAQFPSETSTDGRFVRQRYTIRDRKGPKSKTLCLAPGTKKPKAC